MATSDGNFTANAALDYFSTLGGPLGDVWDGFWTFPNFRQIRQGGPLCLRLQLFSPCFALALTRGNAAARRPSGSRGLRRSTGRVLRKTPGNLAKRPLSITEHLPRRFRLSTAVHPPTSRT